MQHARLPVGLWLPRSAMWQCKPFLKSLRLKERSFEPHESIYQANALSICRQFKQTVVVQAEYRNAQLGSCRYPPEKHLVAIGRRLEQEEMLCNRLSDQVPVWFLSRRTVIEQIKGLFDAVCPAIQLGLYFIPFRLSHLGADLPPKLPCKGISASIEVRRASAHEVADTL